MPRKMNGATADLQKLITQASKEVDALIHKEIPASLDGVVTLYADLRDRQEQIKALASKLTRLAEAMSYEVLPDLFRQTNTVSPYNHVRGKFVIATRVNASINKEDKDGAYRWLRANGLGDLIIETVPWQSLSATAKEMQEKGDDLPSDYFSVTSHEYTRYTPEKA